MAAKRPALRADDRLAQIARGHSEDMAKRHFFDHINAQGEDPTARGRRSGYECRKQVDAHSFRIGLAENLSDVPRYSRVYTSGGRRTYEWNGAADIARQAVDGWMHSPGHRRNILDGAYSDTGVGVAVTGDDVFITQLFC